MNPTGFGTITPQVGLVFNVSYSDPPADMIHRKISLGYRFFTVMDGVCKLSMNDCEYELEPSDVVYLTPGQEYTTIFPAGKRCAFVNLCFEFFTQVEPAQVTTKQRRTLSEFMVQLNFESMDQKKLAEKVEFTDMPEFSQSMVLRGLSTSIERFTEMHKLYGENGSIPRIRLNAELASFLADAAEYLSRMRSSRCSYAASQIVDYINRHADEKLTCRDLAERFNYHPNYCNRIVRDYIGVSLHDYIVSVKVRRADRLLLETELPITEIAYRLSFHDSSHFSSVYQAHTGMKPSERRKQFHSSSTLELE